MIGSLNVDHDYLLSLTLFIWTGIQAAIDGRYIFNYTHPN